MIAKIIHSFSPIHESWKALPHFAYINWEEKEVEALLEKHYPSYFAELKNMNYYLKKDFVKFIILNRFGGMFVNHSLELKKDIYPKLHPMKINVLEKYLNHSVVLDDSLIAVERNYKGMMIFADEIINNNKFENITKENQNTFNGHGLCSQYLSRGNKDFFILPHYQFNVKKNQLHLYNEKEIFIVNNYE
tara:strand:- start:335 stop:904 length:570 start_codon:yes stop_codon:yes gene_type:complete